jgi:hypothetical protein
MHDVSRRSGRRRVVRVLAIAVLLTAVGSATALAAAGPVRSHAARPTIAGTWSGQYSGAFNGKFTLRWKQTGSTLHGSIVLSSPKGNYAINGSVNKGKINFGVVGAGATYTGTWSGKSMSGRYKSPAGGGSWSAHKTS